ncbi:MAG: 6-phosphogluconate dehydrogenase [Planctomycetaceae bacterium]|nr:6-phosphogluconate dehydrogenase [Planctomycetaceae bacterium]
MDTIGLIGVGLLGTALAERLIERGYQILGYDVAEQQMHTLSQLGGDVADSVQQVAERCPRILLSLPTSDIALSVVDQIEANVRADQIIVDTTTGAPSQIRSIGERLAQKNVRYLDATIGGSSVIARRGEVIIMAGGEPGAYADCEDFWSSLSQQSFHVGPVGSGAMMKLVVNMVLGLNRAALAEGLNFARTLGLDLPMTLEVLNAGPAQSAAAKAKGQKMIGDDFEPQARLAQHLKDVRLMLAEAADRDAKVPMSTLHAELLQTAVELGFASSDNSAIIKAYELSQP